MSQNGTVMFSAFSREKDYNSTLYALCNMWTENYFTVKAKQENVKRKSCNSFI